MTAPPAVPIDGALRAEAPNAAGVTVSTEWLASLALVVTVLGAGLYTITPWPAGAYGDDAIYTVLAKSLANGEGYRMINLPGAPHATHFPPGYPFLLSLLWRIGPDFPDNIVVFKFASSVLLAVAAGAVYWYARRRLAMGMAAAVGLAAVGTGSLMTLQLAGLVMSEPLFLALLFLALPIVERTADKGSVGDALLAGTMLGALSLVRTIGAMALGAAILVLLMRRRLPAAIALAAAAAIFLVPWQLWVGAHQAEIEPILVAKFGAYWPWMLEGYREGGFPFARAVVLENLAEIGNQLSYAVAPVNRWWPRFLSLVALVPLVIAGAVVLARRAPVLVWFFALYFAVIIVWPFHPYRFLIAVWPVLALIAGAGALALWRWSPNGAAGVVTRFAAVAVVSCLVIGHVGYNVRGYSEKMWVTIQRQSGESAKPLVEWVSRYTNPDDILATEHDVIVYLYTGRRGVPTSTRPARQRVVPPTPRDFEGWAETILTTYRPRYFVTGFKPHFEAAESLATRTPPVLRRVGGIAYHAVYGPVEP